MRKLKSNSFQSKYSKVNSIFLASNNLQRRPKSTQCCSISFRIKRKVAADERVFVINLGNHLRVMPIAEQVDLFANRSLLVNGKPSKSLWNPYISIWRYQKSPRAGTIIRSILTEDKYMPFLSIQPPLII